MPRRKLHQQRPPTPAMTMAQRKSHTFTLAEGIEPIENICKQPRAKLHVQYTSTLYQLCLCDVLHLDEGAGRCCNHSCSNCGRSLPWNGWEEWTKILRQEIKLQPIIFGKVNDTSRHCDCFQCTYGVKTP